MQALIAFDASLNILNEEGNTPVDLAIIIGRKQHPKHTITPNQKEYGYESLEKLSEMVHVLKSVGALQSETITANRQSPSATSEMPSPKVIPVNHEVYDESERSRCLYKDLEDRINERWADMMSLDDNDEMIAMGKQKKEIERYKKTGSRILCLDGGGMRGLVEIEILMQIEQATGKRITDLFDWIVATSSGAITTIGLVYGE